MDSEMYRFDIGDVVIVESAEAHGMRKNSTALLEGKRVVIRDKFTNPPSQHAKYHVDVAKDEVYPAYCREGWWVYDAQCTPTYTLPAIDEPGNIGILF